MVYGVWFVVYGLWFMVYGLWFMVYGLWFMVYGFMVYGLLLMGAFRPLEASGPFGRAISLWLMVGSHLHPLDAVVAPPHVAERPRPLQCVQCLVFSVLALVFSDLCSEARVDEIRGKG